MRAQLHGTFYPSLAEDIETGRASNDASYAVEYAPSRETASTSLTEPPDERSWAAVALREQYELGGYAGI